MKTKNDHTNQLYREGITPKQDFLEKLYTPSSKRYKRYTESPLRYGGGKSLAVGLIVEKIPDDVSRVISPFIGGASLEIALSKELGLEVIGYDIFEVLTNYWQIQLDNPFGLYDRLTQFSPTPETFKEIKERLKAHWKDKSLVLEPLDLAAHYYYNHNTSYGPSFLGWPSSVYTNPERYELMLNKVKNFRAPTLSVKCSSFADSIPQHQGDFLYCDPPYYLGGDSKMFIGLYPHRNFPIHHKGFDHMLLRDLLVQHKGGFVLSYNDCLEIRELYKDFEILPIEWQYTYGQGETRVGKNRKANGEGHVKKSHEVLILG